MLNLTQYIPLIVEIITFFIVVTAVVVSANAVSDFAKVRQRMGGDISRPSRQKSTLVKKQNVTNPFLMWVQSVTSLNDIQDRQKLRRDLAFAGITGPSAPVIYVVIRYSMAVGFPIAFLFFNGASATPVTEVGKLAIIAFGLCFVGLMLPKSFIDNRAGARKLKLENEFPDALDLMVICIQAGLGLESAFVRVGQEVTNSHPRIAEEFTRVSEELGAGKGRPEALRAMADRTNLEPIKSFAALLIQTDTLGTSIGQTLRTYAVEMRSDGKLCSRGSLIAAHGRDEIGHVSEHVVEVALIGVDQALKL